jgi:lipopolysaccharide/colanic/teichoic acid biosynthesis glycosyltransferase
MINFLSLRISKWSLLLLFGDMVAFCLAVPVGILMIPKSMGNPWFVVELYKIPILFLALTYIMVLYVANIYDHYQDFRKHDNISRVILSVLVGTGLSVMFFSFPSWRIIPRNFVEWHAVAFVWLVTLWRYTFSAVALPTRLQRQVLIVGAGQAGRWIAEVIAQRPNCGLSVKGFVDDDPKKVGTTSDGLTVLGTSIDLIDLINQYKVSLVILGITHVKSSPLLMMLNRVVMSGCELIDIPTLYEFLTGKVPIEHISDMWLFFNKINYHKLYYPRVKAVIDLVLSTFWLLLTWPLFIIIALAIKLDSHGPLLYKQMRMGHNDKPFKILKFRTMFIDSDSEEKPKWASVNDRRITRVGRIIRKIHLDELPQLINILKGEMSLFGPRAEWEVFAQKSQQMIEEWRPGRRADDPPSGKVLVGYREQIPYYSHRFLVRPGLSGWAQVMFPYAGSSAEDLKEKLEYDLYYVKNMGLLLDLAIFMKTIRIVLFGHGK